MARIHPLAKQPATSDNRKTEEKRLPKYAKTHSSCGTTYRDNTRAPPSNHYPPTLPGSALSVVKPSDVRQKIEVFVILVLSAFSLAQVLLRLDKFNALDPLDHLVAKLILNAQPQRSAINLGKRLPVHL